MLTRTNTPVAPEPLSRPEARPARFSHRPPMTTEECLREIEKRLRQVTTYAEFMCQVNSLKGTSTEAKEKAVAAFYERMATLEGQLGRICEELKLG